MRVVTDNLTANIESRHEIRISTRRNPEEQFTIHPPSFNYRIHNQLFEVTNTFEHPQILPEENPSVFGRTEIVQFENEISDSVGMKFQIRFSHTLPLIGIKVTITNLSNEPLRQENILVTSVDSFPFGW